MRNKLNKLPYHKVENYSNVRLQAGNQIRVVKEHQYFIVDGVTITGDAPKALMKIYQYDKCSNARKRNIQTWPTYIVKTGHKWYPVESLTEYLLNLLGVDFGLNMAESDIRWISGQLRFLSKFFLKEKNEELIHGADVFAGFLGDKNFVEEIEENQLSRDLFTLQFVEKSLNYIFPYQKDDIMEGLVKMLIFDALVGNNDRHFYNWGIIRSLDNSEFPVFSPIYDTARGLFWNDSEEKIRKIWYDKNRLDFHIKKYSEASRPKIGWDGEKDINHFKLIEKIYNEEFYLSKYQQKALLLQPVFERMLFTVNVRFKKFFSKERIGLITKCLEYRYNYIERIMS